jgi:E3 ubiquitin-protein ligase UBR7
MGLPRQHVQSKPEEDTNGALEPVKEEDEAGEPQALENGIAEHTEHMDEAPLPPGFPAEDDFDHLICYKCVEAFPWIKQYAGTTGFLPAVPSKPEPVADTAKVEAAKVESTTATEPIATAQEGNKRKAEDDIEDDSQDLKRVKSDTEANGAVDATGATNGHTAPKHKTLPAAPTTSISLFLQDNFRDNFCRCADCFPRLSKHPQLLEEEEAYEPPMSESDGDNQDDARSAAGRSVHSGSLLERGEAALSGVDRVRAIEGVMAYNHLKDKVKAFLQPFAESGQAVGAEDIKAYFAKLRGDEQAVQAGDAGSGDGVEGDQRKEQGGY